MGKLSSRRLRRFKRKVERKLEKRFKKKGHSSAWDHVRQFLQTIWGAAIFRYISMPVISVAWFVMLIALVVFLFEVLSYYVLEAGVAVA